ncbi:Fic family protein [Sulfitobacter pontiacus]|uniref:Fic family protein n=1 Tax=Sulfitobacter pontiacus TaxID=60137 RepID=UPI0021A3338B|nr:Fic family protein [Sulfitobacter pontiacus]UWR17583.1 Fic family protein [Sulfitobacter pontiacus]
MTSLPFDGTPYVLDPIYEKSLVEKIQLIEERVVTLRTGGLLTPETLTDYYGTKRFEQVAESNAIEGSTLSVGETELAVLKGITITGHDPAFARDAIALDRALNRVVEMAQSREEPTTITELTELHGLILGDRPGGGVFRSEPVRIRGSDHRPPTTWASIMTQMEAWEAWSLANASSPAPVRAAVLHAWLAHVHPFIDGNGRTARALTNLELVRAGYPSIIIRKKERDRYVSALSESDAAGDISSFIDLIAERMDGALTGLERSARKKQGFDPLAVKLRENQGRQLEVWNRSVFLLAAQIELNLSNSLEKSGGTVFRRDYSGVADVDEFATLCDGKSISNSWAFEFGLRLPGVKPLEFLAFVGHRSGALLKYFDQVNGPSLHWSLGEAGRIPRWKRVTYEAPFAKEITTKLGEGDSWVAVRSDDDILALNTTKLAKHISENMIAALTQLLSADTVASGTGSATVDPLKS